MRALVFDIETIPDVEFGRRLLDLDGLAPIDQPGVADTGAGVPTYADRGALEAVAGIAGLSQRPLNSGLFGNRERQRVAGSPLAGARGYPAKQRLDRLGD